MYLARRSRSASVLSGNGGGGDWVAGSDIGSFVRYGKRGRCGEPGVARTEKTGQRRLPVEIAFLVKRPAVHGVKLGRTRAGFDYQVVLKLYKR
jgi:hypothetical protein